MPWDKEKYYNDKEYKKRKKFDDEKWRRNNPKYGSKYMKERRDIARKKGICIRCFKNKVKKGVKCRECKRMMGLKWKMNKN